MKFLPLVIRNLLRNSRRTILTILSIGVSIFIFAALMSLPALVRQILRDNVSSLRLVCSSKAGAGFDYTLPASYGEVIRTMPHVDAVSGALILMANYREPGELVPVGGFEATQLRSIWPDWGITAPAANELQHTRSAGLVSSAVLKHYKWKVGDNVTLHTLSPPSDINFTIAGILGDRVPRDFVILPLDRLDKMEANHGRVMVFFIRADRSESANTIIHEVDSRFANSAFETTTQTEMGMALTKVQQLRLLFVGAEIIAAIIVLVIALVAANTSAMAVRERRHELAVMRSIGFTRRTLVGFIVAEGLLMGLVAGAFGALIAYAILRLAATQLAGSGLVLKLMPSVATESIAIAALIGLLSAAIPALNATRRDISDALRAIA